MLAKSFVKPREDLDSQSAALPKITAHAISQCHRRGHCAAHSGTFNIGNRKPPNTRALSPLPCKFCSARDKITLRHNFNRTACDVYLMYLQAVLVWPLVVKLFPQLNLYIKKHKKKGALIKLVAVGADISDFSQVDAALPGQARTQQSSVVWKKMPNYSSKLTTFPLPVY